MKRSARKSDPPVRPVKRIDLSEKNIKLRFILTVICIGIALAAFAFALSKLLSSESGWQEIEVKSSAKTTCGQEFVFQYDLGASGISASVESKQISQLYTDATDYAFMVFSSDSYDDCSNLADINGHINQTVAVDGTLYQALALLDAYDCRYLFLAPIYERYESLFLCSYDFETVEFDPYQNSELRSYYAELADYINDPEAIRLELLGDNQVRLCVSEEYLSFAQENGITSFLDFCWLRNAFILDYVAQSLQDSGYTNGTISSYDGFSRCLDSRGTSYSYNLYDRVEQTVYQAATLRYGEPMSIVCLRNYPMNSLDTMHYYELQTGEIRTPYVDETDGLCKSAVNNLVSFSATCGCAETVLNMLPVYIAEEFDMSRVLAMREKGVETVYCEDSVVYCTSRAMSASVLYHDYEFSYTE